MKQTNEGLKLSILLLIALVGFPQISETIYTPALPKVAAGLNTTAYLVEATLSIYFLGFAAGISLWGAISDWCGRKKAMLAGLLVYGMATLFCGSVEHVYSLLAWRFVQAFGASVGSVITQTILRDAYDGVQRAKLFSVMSGALAFSPALGPVLGGLISEFIGWRANFWFLAFMAIILLIWTFKALAETKPAHVVRPSFSQIAELCKAMLKSSPLWGHILLIGSTNGIIFCFYQEAPFIFIEQLGMHASYYGCLGILIAAATILAARISYRQSQRHSAQTIISWGIISVLIGSMLFAGTVIMGFFQLNSSGMVVALLALFTLFFGIGLVIPSSLSIALKPYQTAIGTAGSIFGFCYYCLIAGYTWMMGVLHNGTALPLAFYIIALGIILVIGGFMAAEKTIFGAFQNKINMRNNCSNIH
ncbi:MAG: multidrug effflux MFS transporter [Chlamydiales bacterium]